MNPISIVQGNGVKVGEDTSVYPVVGLETGFISNVFYQDTNEIGAGLLRVLGEAGVGSLSPQRLNDEAPPEPDTVAPTPFPERGSLEYRFDAYAAYDQYLSGDDRVTAQGGLSGGLVFRAVANPNHPLFVTFLDHFERVIRATNFESTKDTNRDINTLNVRLNYQPPGRTLGGYVYYRHSLDLFEEDTQQFADRFDHTFGLRLNYQWLPLTRVYADVSEGVFGGVGSSSTKVSSYPFAGVVGIMTALSVNVMLSAHVGYAQGFYQSGPDYATVTGGAQASFRYSPDGRILLMYSYEHQDSINANFYRDHIVAGVLEQQFAPFLVFVKPELHLRQYEGLLPQIMPSTPTRDDVIVAVSAGARYNWRNWLATSLEYRLQVDQTDFRYTIDGRMDNPSYVRHEILLGIRAAY